MKAAIYCRVSTEDQEREGTSLDSQLEACLAKAKELGYEVPDNYTFKETYSGLSLDRALLSSVRDMVRKGEIEALIAYTLDRLSRDPVHFIIIQEELEKAGVEIILVTDTLDSSDLGKLIAYIKGFAAKLETEKIKERTIRGKKERVKNGRLPGGRFCKLYGYDYMRGRGIGEGRRYENEAESKVVKEIYRMYVEDGLSLCKITEKLNVQRTPSPSGKNPWNRTAVHYILTNLAYTGKTYLFTRYKTEAKRHLRASRRSKLTHMEMRPRDEWLEAKGATPPIISEELFNQAQLKLRRNKELALRNAKREYLLAGYVFCETCGRRYLARKNTGGRSYYRCPKCKGKGLNAERFENDIWAKVEEALSSPEVVLTGIKMMQDEQNSEKSYHKELARIEVQLRHLGKEKDRIWRAFLVTGDEEKFSREVKVVMSQIEELKKSQGELQNRLEQIKDIDTDIKAIKQYCEKARFNSQNLSFSDKRNALESLRIRVVVNKEQVRIEGTLPIVSSLCA